MRVHVESAPRHEHHGEHRQAEQQQQHPRHGPHPTPHSFHPSSSPCKQQTRWVRLSYQRRAASCTPFIHPSSSPCKQQTRWVRLSYQRRAASYTPFIHPSSSPCKQQTRWVRLSLSYQRRAASYTPFIHPSSSPCKQQTRWVRLSSCTPFIHPVFIALQTANTASQINITVTNDELHPTPYSSTLLHRPANSKHGESYYQGRAAAYTPPHSPPCKQQTRWVSQFNIMVSIDGLNSSSNTRGMPRILRPILPPVFIALHTTRRVSLTPRWETTGWKHQHRVVRTQVFTAL